MKDQLEQIDFQDRMIEIEKFKKSLNKRAPVLIGPLNDLITSFLNTVQTLIVCNDELLDNLKTLQKDYINLINMYNKELKKK